MFSLDIKAQSHICNISMQHLATLSDCVVRELAKNVQYLSTSKTAATKIYHFCNWLNTIQHIATCRNKLPQGGQTCAACCAQLCCKMLHWIVECIQLRLKRAKCTFNPLTLLKLGIISWSNSKFYDLTLWELYGWLQISNLIWELKG